MLARRKVIGRPVRQTPSIETLTIPAPIRGINRVAPAAALPKNNCIHLFNMLAAEYGCRSRLGYQEWSTGLDGPTRSDLTFSGTQANGAGDKHFVTTQTGIWDVTAKSASPTQVVTFASTADLAGYGVSHAVQNLFGSHFLLYADEENGLYVYSENSDTWTKVPAGTTVLWLSATDYEIDDLVQNAGNIYRCIVPGTSAGSGGPTTTAADITDGTVHWAYVSAVVSGAIGPSLADQRNGFTFDPADAVFIGVWKSRVFLVERDTTAAWYLEAGSFLGTATRFDFGFKMPHGGVLAGLWNRSYATGAGMDSVLVAISTSGDVVAYQGSDPADASTFGIAGSWFAGGVPVGRTFATDHAGDVLIISTLGLVPLSKLIEGKSKDDASIYVTYAVQPLFNLLVSTLRLNRGWSIHIHPTDNALLINVPTGPGQPYLQLAMSFATGGWSQYRDLPITCAGVWNGKLYFGTPDGRVCLNDGYVDDVKLDDPSQFKMVYYSLLTGYRNGGNARLKRVHELRPTILSETPDALVEAEARFGQDLNESLPVTGNPPGSSGTWDNAKWDDTVFGGDYSPSQPLQGASGIGREVAVAIRGAAKSRTVFTGVDVFYDEGGAL